MGAPINITIGSTSIHKLNAVRQACLKLQIEAVVSGIKTSSGQNEQPVGFDETFRGALTRATFAKKNTTSVAIGIESGIFRFNVDTPVTLDIAIVVALTNDGKRIITTSEGMYFPEEYVGIAEERGFETTTVGSVIAERLGGDPTDPYTTITKGKMTRTMTLVDALTTALRQL